MLVVQMALLLVAMLMLVIMFVMAVMCMSIIAVVVWVVVVMVVVTMAIVVIAVMTVLSILLHAEHAVHDLMMVVCSISSGSQPGNTCRGTRCEYVLHPKQDIRPFTTRRGSYVSAERYSSATSRNQCTNCTRPDHDSIVTSIFKTCETGCKTCIHASSLNLFCTWPLLQ